MPELKGKRREMTKNAKNQEKRPRGRPRKVPPPAPPPPPPAANPPAPSADLSEFNRIVPMRALMGLFGVSHTAIREWVGRGMPKAARDRFPLGAVLAWWKEWVGAPRARGNLAQIKEEREFYQKELARLEFEERARALLPADKVRTLIARGVEVVKSRFLDLPGRVAPMVDGLPWHETQKILDREVRRVLEGLSSLDLE